MNWFLMILSAVLFMEGLFFEIQSLKPDKGFRYIGWQNGYNVELAKPDPNTRMTDKDGNDITKDTSFVVFRAVKETMNAKKEYENA